MSIWIETSLALSIGFALLALASAVVIYMLACLTFHIGERLISSRSWTITSVPSRQSKLPHVASPTRKTGRRNSDSRVFPTAMSH